MLWLRQISCFLFPLKCTVILVQNSIRIKNDSQKIFHQMIQHRQKIPFEILNWVQWGGQCSVIKSTINVSNYFMFHYSSYNHFQFDSYLFKFFKWQWNKESTIHGFIFAALNCQCYSSILVSILINLKVSLMTKSYQIKPPWKLTRFFSPEVRTSFYVQL